MDHGCGSVKTRREIKTLSVVVHAHPSEEKAEGEEEDEGVDGGRRGGREKKGRKDFKFLGSLGYGGWW